MLKSLKIFCSMKRFSPALDHKGWKSERANERVNLIKGVLIREKKRERGGGEWIRVVNWLEISPSPSQTHDRNLTVFDISVI